MADTTKYISLPQDPSQTHQSLSDGFLPKMTRRKLALFLLIVFVSVSTIMYVILQGGYINCLHFCNPSPLLLHNASCQSSRLTKRRLPHALIIGIRKSGTRAVLAGLQLHPDIVSAGKEIHFFDREERYSKGLEDYRLSLPKSMDSQITIEKSPSYFVYPQTPERVYNMNSSIKLIIVVRDPVERAISDYTQLADKKQKGNEVVPSFEEEVLTKEGKVNSKYYPIQNSVYYIYLSMWLKYFPLDQFLVIDGDHYQKDPHTEMVKVEKFLGLRQALTKDMFVYNKTKGFYCFMQDGEPNCLGETKGRVHPDVDPQVITLLQNYFRPMNERFFELNKKVFDWP